MQDSDAEVRGRSESETSKRLVWDAVLVLQKIGVTLKQQSYDVGWNDLPTARATGLGSEKQDERPTDRMRQNGFRSDSPDILRNHVASR
jgi:hypothetical protein